MHKNIYLKTFLRACLSFKNEAEEVQKEEDKAPGLVDCFTYRNKGCNHDPAVVTWHTWDWNSTKADAEKDFELHLFGQILASEMYKAPMPCSTVQCLCLGPCS